MIDNTLLMPLILLAIVATGLLYQLVHVAPILSLVQP